MPTNDYLLRFRDGQYFCLLLSKFPILFHTKIRVISSFFYLLKFWLLSLVEYD